MIVRVSLIGLMLALPMASVANDVLEDALTGPGFERDERAHARKALDAQVEQPVKGKELSAQIYLRTQKRLAESFDHKIPETLAEPTRD